MATAEVQRGCVAQAAVAELAFGLLLLTWVWVGRKRKDCAVKRGGRSMASPAESRDMKWIWIHKCGEAVIVLKDGYKEEQHEKSSAIATSSTCLQPNPRSNHADRRSADPRPGRQRVCRWREPY